MITTTGGGHSPPRSARTIRTLRGATPDTPIVVARRHARHPDRAQPSPEPTTHATGNARALVAVIDELSGHDAPGGHEVLDTRDPPGSPAVPVAGRSGRPARVPRPVPADVALDAGLFFSGALESQSAEVVVYSDDARKGPEGSVLSFDTVAAVAAVDGVARAEPLAVDTTTALAGGDELDIALFGYVLSGPGAPTTVVEGGFTW